MMSNNTDVLKQMSLAEKDKKYIWHPFTQMQDWQDEDMLIIEKGDGLYLEDTEGNRYLDGVSSLWCNVHGHRVPALDEAIQKQLSKVAHTTFLGLSNVPAIELAEKLVELTPESLTRVFYSDSGSAGVEIALKMAYQYWQQKGKKEKQKFVKLTQAYHGDTLGSVSVGGIDLFHEVYGPLLFETFAIPSPDVYRWPSAGDAEQVKEESLRDLEQLFKDKHDQIAAFVMEPLMQGAAGMIPQPKGYISRVRELTEKYDILLIFDEVATGFGRTGKMFACEHENVSPDLLVLAKGLTGGYLPLAATLATEEVYSAFLGDYAEFKTFFHGHTYTANPLACEVANANLKLFDKALLEDHIPARVEQLEERLKDFWNIPRVGDIRQVGLMVGIELVQNRDSKEPFDPAEKIGIKVIQSARKKGAILRPLGNVIILMPPLAISEQEMDRLLTITYESIEETLKNA